MQTYEEPAKFEEKRVRSKVGSVLYGLCAFALIAEVSDLKPQSIASAIYFGVAAVFFVACNLRNVKQGQYRVLGCLQVPSMIFSLIYLPIESMLLVVILQVLMIVPMMLPMDNRTLYFLRPISIVKSPLPIASPQVFAMVSPIMPPMMSPQMTHMAYPTMPPHAVPSSGSCTSPNHQ